MRPAAIEAARAVLVEGFDQAEVARHHGLTRQRINQIIVRVEAAAAGAPRNWVRVACWLPPEIAAQVQSLAERLARAPGDAQAVAQALRQCANEGGHPRPLEQPQGQRETHDNA
ncbi:hypothetical protein CKO27_10685 [Thiocystis violacea]|nr:hypothetical protein [Thiocystis violacea]